MNALTQKDLDFMVAAAGADFRAYDKLASGIVSYLVGPVKQRINYHGLEVREQPVVDNPIDIQFDVHKPMSKMNLETLNKMVDQAALILSNRMEEEAHRYSQIYIDHDLELHADLALIRKKRFGFYGWMRVGFGGELLPEVKETWREHQKGENGETVKVSKLEGLWITEHEIPFEFSTVKYWAKAEDAINEAFWVARGWNQIWKEHDGKVTKFSK